MDWMNDPKIRLAALKKYRYIGILLLAGVLLMILPVDSSNEADIPIPAAVREPTLQESLAGILSQIYGAGRVEVLLTTASGAQTHYQTDEDIRDGDIRRDTVLIGGGGREENGLVRRVDPPVYQGAVILCQGADSSRVCLDIVEAVKSATGLTADRITVLKMK